MLHQANVARRNTVTDFPAPPRLRRLVAPGSDGQRDGLSSREVKRPGGPSRHGRQVRVERYRPTHRFRADCQGPLLPHPLLVLATASREEVMVSG